MSEKQKAQLMLGQAPPQQPRPRPRLTDQQLAEMHAALPDTHNRIDAIIRRISHLERRVTEMEMTG